VATEPAPAGPTTLAGRRIGTGPTVALMHGFAQTGACLGPLAEDLATDHTVVLPDAPGHGGSAVHAAADLDRGADLLAATVGPAHHVGYSMGARLVLTLAVTRPDAVRSLVLIGGTAGIEDAAERAARVADDEALARTLERDGLDAFLDAWLALPLFTGLPGWARFDVERRANTATGLAASLRAAGTGAMTPLWDRLDELAGVPVLVVTGASDTRFTDIGGRLVDRIGGRARRLVVPGAGHSAHLEAPAEVTAAVRGFLAEADGQPPTSRPPASNSP
jgi:2-succinyl-6-hydroxy-2,4-cyclohexadiene-1-carboxylate synthase